jgi:hypothetical protein
LAAVSPAVQVVAQTAICSLPVAAGAECVPPAVVVALDFGSSFALSMVNVTGGVVTTSGADSPGIYDGRDCRHGRYNHGDRLRVRRDRRVEFYLVAQFA